jgi:hypothetical protein
MVQNPLDFTKDSVAGATTMTSDQSLTTSGNPYEGPELNDGKTPQGRSVVGTLLKLGGLAAIVVVIIELLPNVGHGPSASRRTQCKNNLKQIALALHNYHDVYESFPPAYTVDENGNRLHSWRTLILPYLEQQQLYSTIDLSKSWQHPANAEALKSFPTVYRCLSGELPEHHTPYLGLVGESLCFHPTRGRSLSEITDGTSNTLIVMEVALQNSVPWMSPQDADEQMFLSLNKDDEVAHMGGVQAALADGSVRFLSATMATETRRAIISINGNETVGEF